MYLHKEKQEHQRGEAAQDGLGCKDFFQISISPTHNEEGVDAQLAERVRRGKIFHSGNEGKKNCGAARPHRVGAKKKRERDMQA